jgi:hypothetical protein
MMARQAAQVLANDASGAPWRRWRDPVVAASLLLLSFYHLAAAGELRCADVPVTVVAAAEIDRNRVCAAAAAAAAFLATLGLPARADTGITITLLQELPGNNGGHAIGRCHPRRQRIEILSYDAALQAATKYPPAFGVPMSTALWESYVAHEMAHAVAQAHFAAGVPTFTASEYLAAVTQLTTLSPNVRERILANYSDTIAFEQDSEITELFYCTDPSRFAVKAYLHSLKPENGAAFVRRLLQQGLAN